MARIKLVLIVAVVASLAVSSLTGVASFAAFLGEAQAAGEVLADPGAGAPAAEARDCPCPSEERPADCDEERCAVGLLQAVAQGPGTRVADPGGWAPVDLSGLARGPEPAPPRSLG